MIEGIISFMNTWGYLGIFILVATENNILAILPSEVILLFGGALTASALGGKLSLPLAIIVATLGSIAGATVTYYIGNILKTERLKKLASGKLGKIFDITPDDIDKADKWFDEKGNISVLLGRCLPIFRTLISIPAGMSEMPLPKFMLYTGVGSLAWNTLLITIGHHLGNNWQSILSVFDNAQTIMAAIIAVLLVVFLVWWFKLRKKPTKKEAKSAKQDKESDGKNE